MEWLDRTIRDFRTSLTGLRLRVKTLEEHDFVFRLRFDAVSSSLEVRAKCEANLSARIDEIERRQALIDQYWQGRDMSERDKAEDFYRNGDGKPFEKCDMIELLAAFNNYSERIFHTLNNFSDPEKTHSRQLAGLCELRDEAYNWILTRKRDGKE